MVRSAPTQGQTVASKPRRRSNGGITFLLLLVFLLSGSVFVAGFLMPARLALLQEQVLSVVHGGVDNSDERTFVECMPIQGVDGPQAVTRTTRTITFRDGTSLVTVFSSKPAPTNSLCGG